MKLALMFKNGSHLALSTTAKRIRPSFLYNFHREAEVYRTILTPSGLSTPTFYGAMVDPIGERSWLFLERVTGRELYQNGDFDMWKTAACWLADVHHRFAQPGSLICSQRAVLLQYDDAYFGRWMHRVETFAERGAVTWSKESQRDLMRLAKRYEVVVEQLTSLPKTLLHGEFYASNVLLQSTENRTRVCPVDWETAGIGPGLIDLAALVAGAWQEEEKRELALAYWSTMVSHDREGLPVGAFLRTLDFCRLHLSIQWLGWSPEWVPPPAHAHDWLGEALQLSQRLGL